MLRPTQLLAAVTALAALASGCTAPAPQRLDIPGATPIAYGALRDASGAVGFAETALPVPLARTGFTARAGQSPVDPAKVAGAWALPQDTDFARLPAILAALGRIDHAKVWRDGQLWTARLDREGQATWLLAIDGTHPRFAQDQPPGLRPAARKYLIAYRGE